MATVALHTVRQQLFVHDEREVHVEDDTVVDGDADAAVLRCIA
jgi:hypothetical protein